MKKLLFPVTILLFLQTLQAQQKEGTITYERKMNMWKRLADEQIRSMIPEFRSSKYVLMFNDSVSIYKTSVDENGPDPFAGNVGGGAATRINFRGFGGEGELYKNFNTGLSTKANELGGKNFLIVDTIKKTPWKITTETKEILGLICRKAILKKQAPTMQARTMSFNRNSNTTAVDTTKKAVEMKNIEIVAWFAESISTPAGPDEYGKLPGVILELNIDEGAMIYTATDIKKQ